MVDAENIKKTSKSCTYTKTNTEKMANTVDGRYRGYPFSVPIVYRGQLSQANHRIIITIHNIAALKFR